MAAIGLQGGDTSTDCAPVHCREDETAKLVAFCQQCALSRTAASMYISGTPGVGKTLTIHSAQRILRAWHREQRGLELSVRAVTFSFLCNYSRNT
eukprot:SAG31_NODE_14665_length_793_cov_1.786744_1_plen_94_part_10